MKVNLNRIKKNKSVAELLEFGILNIDKSSGPTSFTVSEFVCKKLELRKTSHFGTLDPKVTGVLPIALNRACKFTGYFLGHDKTYVGIMRTHEDVELKDIEKIIKKKFLGKITQLPPVRSRVKRAEREREVKRFELIEKDGKNILFLAEVEGGTYIRKLLHDLGEEIGGAHMLELRRTHAGIFSEEKLYTLYDFEKAVAAYEKDDEKLLREMIVPAEVISEIYPSVEVKKSRVKDFWAGKKILKDDLVDSEQFCIPQVRNKGAKFKPGDTICVFAGDDFIEIAEVIEDQEIFAKPKFVMQPIK